MVLSDRHTALRRWVLALVLLPVMVLMVPAVSAPGSLLALQPPVTAADPLPQAGTSQAADRACRPVPLRRARLRWPAALGGQGSASDRLSRCQGDAGARSARMSRIGERPKKRLYSRLNWLALS